MTCFARADGKFGGHPIEEVPDLGPDDRILKIYNGHHTRRNIIFRPVIWWLIYLLVKWRCPKRTGN